MQAIQVLIVASKDLQREIVESGRVSVGEGPGQGEQTSFTDSWFTERLCLSIRSSTFSKIHGCCHPCAPEGAAASHSQAHMPMGRSWSAARSPGGSQPQPPAAGSLTQATSRTCSLNTVYIASLGPQRWKGKLWKTGQIRRAGLVADLS